MRKATGNCRTYLSLVKLQPWFLSLQWKTAFGQNCNRGSCVCMERPALGQNTLMMDDDDDDDEVHIFAKRNSKSMIEASMKLCSVYSYYRRNMGAKNEQSRRKMVQVRNLTHCRTSCRLIYSGRFHSIFTFHNTPSFRDASVHQL